MKFTAVFAFAILLIVPGSKSLAIPLVGSEQRVEKTHFCQTYHCRLISQGMFKSSNPAEESYTESIYTTHGKGKLQVVKDGKKTVMTNLIFEGLVDYQWAHTKGNTYIADYIKDFSDLKSYVPLSESCKKDSMSLGVEMGRTKNYQVYCGGIGFSDGKSPQLPSTFIKVIMVSDSAMSSR